MFSAVRPGELIPQEPPSTPLFLASWWYTFELSYNLSVVLSRIEPQLPTELIISLTHAYNFAFISFLPCFSTPSSCFLNYIPNKLFASKSLSQNPFFPLLQILLYWRMGSINEDSNSEITFSIYTEGPESR